MGGSTKTVSPKIPKPTETELAIEQELMKIFGFTRDEEGNIVSPEGEWKSPYEITYRDEMEGAYKDHLGYQDLASDAIKKALGYTSKSTGYFNKAAGYSSKFDEVASAFDALNRELSSLGGEVRSSQEASKQEMSDMTRLLIENADLLLPIIQEELPALQRGEIPEAYQKNFESYMGSAIDTAMGTVLNDLAKRGVIGSSVLERQVGLSDDAIAEAAASNFASNIGLLKGLSESKAGMIGQRGTLLNDAERAILDKYGLLNEGFATRAGIMGQKGSNLEGKKDSYTGAVNALLGAGQGYLGAGSNALGAGDSYNKLSSGSLAGMANLLGLSNVDYSNYWQSVGSIQDIWKNMYSGRHGVAANQTAVYEPGPLDYMTAIAPLFFL